jgi:hypothetical protein
MPMPKKSPEGATDPFLFTPRNRINPVSDFYKHSLHIH